MAGTTFLFWNLDGKPLQAILARLAWQHAVDVLILAECEIAEAEMLRALNVGPANVFSRTAMIASRGIELYSRLPPGCFGTPLVESDHYVIRPFRPPGGIEILLAVAHLASPSRKHPPDLGSRCRGFSQAIRDAESQSGNERTVVIGDLNVNPFHDGMLDVRGLNAVWDRNTVKRKDPRRFGKIAPEAFRMFYNPMWSHLGDATAPSGTYYYDQSNPEVDPLWNIFDQVLVRQDLIDRFDIGTLKILTTDGVVNLMTPDGRPDRNAASDHLPILFQFTLSD